jgi:hypothetical protein
VYILAVGIAVILAIFARIAVGAGKKGVGIAFGIASFLTFIYWLNTGPGHDFLNWIENPTGPEIPDTVRIPGQE